MTIFYKPCICARSLAVAHKFFLGGSCSPPSPPPPPSGPYAYGAYFCYCAYVLRISRYSGFLRVVPSNTAIFLRGLKLLRKQILTSAFGKASVWKKTHTLLCILLFSRIIFPSLSLKKKCVVTPQFSFWISIALT